MLAYSFLEIYARLLFVVPIVFAGGFVLTLCFLVLVKYIIRRVKGVVIDAKIKAERIGPDGRAYPPSGCGVCDNCTAADNKVYYLPSGKRLCRKCYLKTIR